MRDLGDKTVVVTGGSSGIGLETARALAARGARVVMVVRSKARGDAAIANIRTTAPDARVDLVLADLYSLAEVRRAGAELRAMCDRLDVLVNNAGLIHPTRELTGDGFERTFALNHLAAFLLTYELRELLAASAPARVVTVSSMGHMFARFDWDDLATMTRWKGETAVYGASKLCNIW
ncbi:MAG: SDR family NAD(P)-dependent oxidoreductase, partial [Deltaproteobacteria bacterium]|nr:SDR family NAD(P)-dependent oxidoreductase [Deltaproteobacteria bacterium]